MHFLRSTSRRRAHAITAVLALLLLRAWVPVGFMPAQGEGFRLQLCQADRSLAATVFVHGARSHGHGDPCPFGSSPPAAPITQVLALEPPQLPSGVVAITRVRQAIVSGLLRAHCARGPPTLV